MITDRIAHAALYSPLSPRIARAVEYLQQTDLAALQPGTYELEGRHLYVIVQEYTTKPRDQGRWEAHCRYADLQVVAEGTEAIGYAPMTRLEQESYDQSRDDVALSGQGEFITLDSGCFMLLWPGEGHMPGIAIGDPAPVKKIVIKIDVERGLP